jgi:cell wall-associated NlpC family hydrolase
MPAVLIALLAVAHSAHSAHGAPQRIAAVARIVPATTEELDRRIADAARQLEVVVEEYNNSREDLQDTVTESRALGAQLTPMAVDLQEQQDRIGDIAADTYRHTPRGPSVALFASRTPDQFVNQMLLLNQIAMEQQRSLNNLAQARDRVASAQRTLGALAAQQRRQQREINAKKATVQGEIAALKGLREVAYRGGTRLPASIDLPAPPYVAGPAGLAVAFAYRQLGKPYRWGSAGPNSYDCSGLTMSAWARAGVSLPHNARRQYGSMAHINRADLRPGDLIFYYGGISHVAMYVGGGKMIHAPEYGENVRVDRYDSQPIHGFGRPS